MSGSVQHSARWEICAEDPNCLKIELPGVGAQNTSWLLNHIEGMPSLESMKLFLLPRFSYGWSSQELINQVAIPLVEAYRRSRATELEVQLWYGASYLEFLSHEACREAITKLTFKYNFPWQSIAAFGKSKNLQSLRVFDCNLPAQIDEPEDYSNVLSNFLDAAVGTNSNLLEFVLEFYAWRLEPVAVSLKEILPYLSTQLQKLKLVVVCHMDDAEDQGKLDYEKINAFQARIVAALGQNTDLLALKSFELELHNKSKNQPDLIDKNTKQQFRAFVAKKSIQQICAEDAAFQRAALPKALEQLQSNPHLNNHSQYSATMLFHCLRKDEHLQEALTQVQEADAEDGSSAESQMASKETIEILPESTTTKRKREDGTDSNATEEIQECGHTD